MYNKPLPKHTPCTCAPGAYSQPYNGIYSLSIIVINCFILQRRIYRLHIQTKKQTYSFFILLYLLFTKLYVDGLTSRLKQFHLLLECLVNTIYPFTLENTLYCTLLQKTSPPFPVHYPPPSGEKSLLRLLTPFPSIYFTPPASIQRKISSQTPLLHFPLKRG